MPQLKWTPQALSDLQRLYRFLANKDKNAASQAIKEVRTAVKVLAHQPLSGRPIDDFPTAFREWPISFGKSGYVALYHFDGGAVVILAVRHQREVGWDK